MTGDIPAESRPHWARTELRIWPERYWLVAFPRSEHAFAAGILAEAGDSFAAIVRDHREISLTVADELWRRHAGEGMHHGALGPLRAISFDIPLEIEVVGYLAPAAARLAAAGVSIVPQCAFVLDHLLVQDKDLATCEKVLAALIEEARAGA